MHTVLIDGQQYVAVQEVQQAAPTRPVRVVDGSEASLIRAAQEVVSDSNWAIGEAAAKWMKKFSRSRSDADFASLVNLGADQVFQRRRVWETFADVRDSYPRLLWSHFYAALDWDNAAECLKWAQDVHAGVAEMRAWHRAMTADE